MEREVFLSYSREDQDAVARLGGALQETGYLVSWDRDLGGGLTWTRELERKLEKSDCVVVLWSRHSIGSGWVLQEAQTASERGVFLPVMIDGSTPPSPFDAIQAVDLTRWNGDRRARELELLVDAIQNLVMTHDGMDMIEVAVRKMAKSFERVDLPALANAAESGDAEAQWMLGEGQMHGLEGLAVAPDEAVHWLTSAAEQGHADAASSLGIYHFLLLENSGVAMALPWFELAAQLGDGYSAWMAGEIHGHGFGNVRKNLLLGRQFKQRAAELGYE